MACIYIHRRLDDNTIFYVGIGSSIKRAYVKGNRTLYWKNIVKKVGYLVEIIEDNLSWEKACEKEIELIKLYGRKDLGNGELINMTDGGEGVPGRKYMPKKSSIEKMKKTMTGRKLSIEHVNAIKTGQKSGKVREFTAEFREKLIEKNKNRIYTPELRKKISDIRKGNPSNATGKKWIWKNKPTNIVCPHCNLEGMGGVMKRWHFENCKYKFDNIN